MISHQTNPVPSTSPGGFIRWALTVVPAQTRFVLSSVLVFAAVALILSWVRSFSLWTVTGLAILVIVFALIVTALSSTVSSKNILGVGSFLAWGISILFISVLVLIISSTFFGHPLAGALLMSHILATSEPLTQLPSPSTPIFINPGDAVPLASLPQEIREEPSEQDLLSRVQAISKRPPLNIGGMLTLSTGERRFIVASTLRLEGGTIVTNGADLTIEVNNLFADNGSIKAFENLDASHPGVPGLDGGRVLLIVHGTITGRLGADLRGQKGANGATGLDGAKGSKGAKGDNAASGVFDCQRGAGRGGQGGPGGQGGDAKDGLAGGRGGILIVRATNIEAARSVIGLANVAGGPGGSGGAPGKGGPGGDGGDGGSPVGLCSGAGPNGAEGPHGADGAPGKTGAAGAAGEVRFEPLPSV